MMSKEISAEKKEDYLRLKRLFQDIEGVTLHGSKSGAFTFPIYLTAAEGELDIGMLDLSVRAYNSLRRAGIGTIGQLVNTYQHSSELKKIRGCGASTIAEIMESLFFYQLNRCGEAGRSRYIDEVIRMNAVRN